MEREGEREQWSANSEPEAEARGSHPYWDSSYSSHFPLPQWSFAIPDTDTGIQYQVSLQIIMFISAIRTPGVPKCV